MPSVAVTIGSYNAPAFLLLSVIKLRQIFGRDVPILISDDLSSESSDIRSWADDSGLGYICSPSRRGHFCGDLCAMVHGQVFAESCGCDVSLKLSQKFIVLHPDFRVAMERAFEDPVVQVATPGRPLLQQLARPGARFYARFGLLTDVIAIRSGAITGQEIRDIYADQFENAKTHTDSLIEVTVDRMISTRFPGPASVLLPEWTNHTPFKPKLYLRKSQSVRDEYVRAAAEVGMESDFDLREWLQIEKNNYLCRPSCV